MHPPSSPSTHRSLAAVELRDPELLETEVRTHVIEAGELLMTRMAPLEPARKKSDPNSFGLGRWPTGTTPASATGRPGSPAVLTSRANGQQQWRGHGRRPVTEAGRMCPTPGGGDNVIRSTGTKKGLALFAALGLAIGACGPAATSSPSSPAATSGGASPGGASAPAESAMANACGDAPVTLNIWGGYPEMDPVYKKAGEAYKALHPNVDFTVFSTDLRGFEQKLTTALPSKTAGDVVVRTTNFLARFIDQDLLAPVPDDLAGVRSTSGPLRPDRRHGRELQGQRRGRPDVLVRHGALLQHRHAGRGRPVRSSDLDGPDLGLREEARQGRRQRATSPGPASASG